MLVQASPSTYFQSWSFTLKIWKILLQVFASDVNENNKSNSSTDCYPALTLESPVYRYGRVATVETTIWYSDMVENTRKEVQITFQGPDFVAFYTIHRRAQDFFYPGGLKINFIGSQRYPR